MPDQTVPDLNRALYALTDMRDGTYLDAQLILNKPLAAALLAERDELRAALLNEWRGNHEERCTNEWPHEGRCSCPPPDVLGLAQ